MALVTVEQFAGYLQRDLSPAEAYTAGLLLDAVTAEVQAHCGWHIAPTGSATVTVDGSGAPIQALPTLHLVDLVSVTEDGTAVDLTDVQWSAAGYMWRSTAWTGKLRGVVADIEHGYAEAPAEVTAIVCAAAARGFSNPAGVLREASGGESVSYAAESGAPLAATLTELELRILSRRYQIANPA